MSFLSRSASILVLCVAPLVLEGREPLRILDEECFRCHNEEKRKGGLLMTSREALVQGGDSGPALKPGSSRDSLLFQLLAPDAAPHMPPKEQLSQEEIARLARWIEAEAPWNDSVLLRPPSTPARLAFQPFPDRYRPITGLCLSPDRRFLAAARGNQIELYDLRSDSPEQVATLLGHRDAVQSLAWSPDGKALASGGFRQVLLWDTAIWERVVTLRRPLEGRVTALLFRGQELVTADSTPSHQGRLHRWDLANFAHLGTIEAHRDSIFDLSLSPDGNWAATASADKQVHLWNPETWERRFTLEGHTGYVLTTVFSPQSDRLATAGDDEMIKVWNLTTRKQIHGFTDRLPTQAVTDLHWGIDPAAKPTASDGDEPAPPEDWIVAVSEDGKPRAYTKLQVHDGTQRSGGATTRAWSGVETAISALTWLPGKKLIATGNVAGELHLWDSAGKLQGTLD